MKVETLVRRGALVAIPALLAAALVWLRREPPPTTLSPNPGPSVSTSAATSASGRVPKASAPVASAALPPVPAPSSGDDALSVERRQVALELEAPTRMAADVSRVDTSESLGVVPVARGMIEFEPVDEPKPRPAPRAAELTPERQCGGLLVRLITATTDASWSFASISPSPAEAAAIHRVGDAVGAYRVADIEWDRVWLNGASGRCALTMNPGVREGRLAVGRREGDAPLGSDAAPAWSVPDEVVEGIRKRSQTEYEVDTDAVASIFERGADLIAGVRIEPVKRADQVIGVALQEIAQGSLLDRLGVETGDVVLALNERPLVTFDAAVSALGAARQQRRLVARLERGGEAFDLDVSVR